MKIFSKLFLTLLILSSTITQASFYSWAHAYFELNRNLTIALPSVIGFGQWAHYKSNIKNLPDAPEIVVDFCHQKLKEQGINPEEIRIKVKESPSFLAAFGRDCIVFTPLGAENLKKALENPTDENAIRVAKIYSTFIDHEISHLKNNDVPHRLAALVGASALTYLASHYLVKSSPVSSWFQEPKNLKELPITWVSYGAASMGSLFLIRALHGLYAQHQEKRADAYAISLAKDPEALRHSAKFLESVDNSMIDFICGADLNPNIPLTTKLQLRNLRNMLTTQYQALKPKEDLRTWVKEQTTTLALMKFILDAEHPSGFSRAEIMRIAADLLEADQKTVADAKTAPAA